MPEKDKSLRHAYTAGKLYKVPISILHDTGANHTGIPSPLDEHIGDDYILYADTQQPDHGKYHDLAGERKHHIHHTHDNFFYYAPEISSHDA